MPRHPPCALKHFTTTRCSHPLCNTQHTTTPRSDTGTTTPTTNALGTPNQEQPCKKTPGVFSGPNSVPNLVLKSSLMIVFHPAVLHPRSTNSGARSREHRIRDKDNHNTHDTRATARTVAVCLTNTVRLLRKEVIQPHLPVRLPCYDFVPIASPTFDNSLPQAG